jgi:cytochrome bd-type quinol oxidase subunit 2
MNNFKENTKSFSPLNSSNKFPIGKILNWICGIVLAGVLTLGSANFIMHHNGNVDMNKLNWFQYWVVYLTVPSLAFGLFVFLSCVFVPLQKKYAAILVLLLSIIFIGLGMYQHYIDDGFLRNQYIVRYTGFIIGLAMGFILSYKVFKENNWSTS